MRKVDTCIYEIEKGKKYKLEISNGRRDDGKRERIFEYVDGDIREARRKRDEIKLKIQNKTIVPNGGYSFLDLTRQWLNDPHTRKLSPSTLNGYKQKLNKDILPVFDQIRIKNIKPADLENFYNSLRNRKSKTKPRKQLSETTITHHHKIIKTILNYGVKKGYIVTNPANLIMKPPTYDSKERNFYNSDEIEFVFKKLEKMDIRFRTAITLLFNTGFRRSELLALKWGDINLDRKEISIRRALVQLDKVYEKETKTEKSRRTITVVSKCIDLLNEYRKHQKDMGFSANARDFVFINKNGEVMAPNLLTREWTDFVEKNDLKKITVHDIRHSHATYLLSLGINVKDVARRLGHSEVSTTYDIYSHSTLLDDQNITSKLETALYDGYKNKEENEIPLEILLSITTNKNFTNDKEGMFKFLEKITDQGIVFDDYEDIREKVSKYIRSENRDLDKISEILEKLNKEESDYFIDMVKKDKKKLFSYNNLNVEELKKIINEKKL